MRFSNWFGGRTCLHDFGQTRTRRCPTHQTLTLLLPFPYWIPMQSSPLADISLQQLKQAVAIREKIESLEKELSGIIGGQPSTAKAGAPALKRKRRRMSAATWRSRRSSCYGKFFSRRKGSLGDATKALALTKTASRAWIFSELSKSYISSPMTTVAVEGSEAN